jgi:hypothetical protein
MLTGVMLTTCATVLQMLITDSHLSECMDWGVKPSDARIVHSLSNMFFYRQAPSTQLFSCHLFTFV